MEHYGAIRETSDPAHFVEDSAEEAGQDIADRLLNTGSLFSADEDEESNDDSDEYQDDQEEEESNSEVDVGDRYPILLSPQQKDAAWKFLAALDHEDPSQVLLPLFHELVLSIFTTQIKDAESRRFNTVIEATLIALSLHRDGSFRPTVEITPCLSKLQYIALFSILKQTLLKRSTREVSV